MTRPISALPFRWQAATMLLFAWILLPGAASALPSYCSCPYEATSSQGGSLSQNTCESLESNLNSNLRSVANSYCGTCGACIYSYTTDYPSCTVINGFYTQAATLTYACGIYTGPDPDL
jgi:hypothetical protein